MKPAFYDTDCLSCFIVIDDTSILEEQFKCIYLPYEVYEEFDRSHIQNLKNRVDNLIKKGFVKVIKFDTNSEDYLLFMELSSDYFSDKTIGKGEAAVIVHAKKHNGIVASNNTRDIMPYVEKYNLERITTGDILVMALENGIITEKEGDIIWSKMLKRNRWLNADTFTSYLNK
ncbi:MAG: nucleic acid-binding protein [Methanobrevibacter ruminantium]|uniref:nucleic acid-binding protein n=1 Tax=Methanobrevibacter ruminantium TaxID=83816 RepID=UPI0026E95AB2|nr:nucleic acid-binding protein [Methanobrevibacter ruminantium]MDO5843481.1 nucleic acid-binding protein [Methanobrevibacter ruminantium]